MKQFVLFMALVIGGSVMAQTPIKVDISGNIFNTNGDSIHIAQYFGTHYKDYLNGKLDKKGNYHLKGTLPSKDYYVLRVGNQHINLILRDSSTLRVNADGKNIAYFSTIVGSDESVQMNEFIRELQSFNQKRDTASAMLRRTPENQQAINQSFQQEYLTFQSYRQGFIARNQNSPALIPVLSTLDMEKEFSIYESVVQQLSASFSGSPNVEGIKQQYNERVKQRDAMNFLAPGKVAPDFTQNDTNDKPLSLSSLRGSVVLIDFWASWCRPCRAENPNVVKLYNKYKDKGFTVMSVSLDKDKQNWLAAIAADGLAWPNHVSDLKYWSNAVAQQYKVSGIPFTVLIDAEGKVIGTKLRGADLENTLKNIYGF